MEKRSFDPNRAGPAPAEASTPPVPSSVGRAAVAVLRAVEQDGPVTLTALAASTGSHENTLREHVQTLQRAGLVRRVRGQSHGRGRPPWLYSAVPAHTGPVAEYAGLARTLAGVLHRTSPHPSEDALVAGMDWGRELVRTLRSPSEPAEPADVAAVARAQVVHLLDEMGFSPESDDAGNASVRLPRCPLLDAAREYPDVVCAVHLGIAKGALREHGADDSGVTLLPFSEPGACRLHLTAGTAEPAADH